MRCKTIVSALATCLFLLPAAANADVLYSNGPINGTINAFPLNSSNFASDSFTLSQASTITGVTFGAWVYEGSAAVANIGFGIVSTAANYTISGSASVTTGPLLKTYGAYDITSDSFSVGSISLDPGTYYLVLGDPTDKLGNNNNIGLFWDQNNGPSTATSNNYGSINSESFDILGTVNAVTVPEAPGWTLMLGGILSLAGFAAMRRRKTAEAA